MNLSKTNHRNFSIPFDESHLFSKSTLFEDSLAKKRTLEKIDTMTVTIDKDQTILADKHSHCGSLELSEVPLIENSDQKPKSFCAKICCCFS